jgi:hypothetical protein
MRTWSKSYFPPVTRVAKVPARLQSLVQCRDGPHCSLIEASGHHDSGQAESAYIIPPGILECPDDLRIQRPLFFSLFEIFLIASKVSRLRAMLLDESDPGVLKNLWLFIAQHSFRLPKWSPQGSVEVQSKVGQR